MDQDSSLFPLEHDFPLHHIVTTHDFDDIPNLEGLELPGVAGLGSDGLDEEFDFDNYDFDGFFQSSAVGGGCSCCTRSFTKGASGVALDPTGPTDTDEGFPQSSTHSGNLSPTRNLGATVADVSSPPTRADLPVVTEAPVAFPRPRDRKAAGAVQKRRRRRPSTTAVRFQRFGSVHVRAEAIFLQFGDGQEECSWRRHHGWINSARELYSNEVLLSLLSADPTSLRIKVRPGGDGYPLLIAFNSDGYFEGVGAWRGVRVGFEDVRKMVEDPQDGQFSGELF